MPIISCSRKWFGYTSEEVRILAVQQNWLTIAHIDRPSEKAEVADKKRLQNLNARMEDWDEFE